MGVAGRVFNAPRPIESGDDLAEFDCDEPSLTSFLQRRALRNEGRASRSFVVTKATDPQCVVAYYTLAVDGMARASMPGELRRNMPDRVPLIIIGRLAVDRRHSGRGLGAWLLRDALLRSIEAARIVGARAVAVQALSERAAKFYRQFGFQSYSDEPLAMVLPMEKIIGSL